jgi:hypothetical protein
MSNCLSRLNPVIHVSAVGRVYPILNSILKPVGLGRVGGFFTLDWAVAQCCDIACSIVDM